MKKKLILCLVLALSMGYQVYSQTYVVLVKPTGCKEWGYVNLKGEYIVEAKLRKCTKFSEDGFATVYDRPSKQFYFLNTKGERLQTEIKDFIVYEIYGFGVKGFENGMVAVKTGKKWGYLNTQGRLVIPLKYKKASEFNSDHAVVESKGKFIIIDKQGVELTVDIPDLVSLKQFSEQLAPYKASDGNFGFIDTQGKVAIKAQYQAVGYFNNGLAWARKGATFGFINPQGEWAIQPQFTGIKNFDPESGLARVKVGEEWTYVNRKGEIINVNIDISSTIADFSCGLAKGKKDDNVGFYTPQGTWAIEPQFDAARDFKNGYASVKVGETWGVIDKTGNWVIQPVFDCIKDVEMVK